MREAKRPLRRQAGRAFIALLVSAMLVLTAGGLFTPNASHAEAGTYPVRWRALYVIAETWNWESYVNDYNMVRDYLAPYGVQVDLLNCFPTGNGLEPISYPAYTVRQALTNTEYNMVFYYGHGNTGSWGWSLPCDPDWNGYTVNNAQTWDEQTQYLEQQAQWQNPVYPTWNGGTEPHFKLAPNAIIVMLGACYANGLNGDDALDYTPLLSDSEVLNRINNYSYTFLHPTTGINKQYISTYWGNDIAHLLFSNYSTPIGDLVVPNAPNGTLLLGNHYYAGTVGDMTYRKFKHSGTTNSAVWNNNAWAGLPYMTLVGSLGGVPGDNNGDGDNTDAGEPNYDPNRWNVEPLPAPPSGYDSVWYFAEGYTGFNFKEYLTLGNPNDADTNTQIVYLSKDGSWKEQQLPIPHQSRTTVDVNSVAGPDKEVSVRIASDQPIVAERPMYFSYDWAWTGGHDTLGATAPSQTWYFAEGYTGEGFDEYACVLNPGQTTANLTFRFQTEEQGEVVKPGYSVPAQSRATFKVNDLLGPNYQTSLKLESDQPVVAERPMYFDYSGKGSWGWTGGHCVMGAPSLSTEYYFAEGTTRSGFEEYLTIQNPGTSQITVTATYQLGAGQGNPIEKKYDVGAGKRRTIYVPDEAGIEKDVSVKLTSAAEFLAERPMYFNYTGYGADNYTGGHCVLGAPSTSAEWLFAEGYTGGEFQEWLCLQNPGDQDSTVEISYLTQEAGQLPTRTEVVPKRSRVTIRVNDHAGPDYQLSAHLKVVSGPGITAERPMYFNYNGWDGGHDVVGYNP